MTIRDIVWRIAIFISVESADWQHLALGAIAILVTGQFWAGLVLGLLVELFQYLLLDDRDLHVLDRVADLWGWTMPVFAAVMGLAVLPAYAVLWGMRRLGW